MSLLYKHNSDVTTMVEISSFSGRGSKNPRFIFEFSADCGKFGADEMLASFEFTAEELLNIFNNHMDNELIERISKNKSNESK